MIAMDEERVRAAWWRAHTSHSCMAALNVKDRRELVIAIRRDNGDIAKHMPDGSIEVDHVRDH